ncbi:MAG: carboxymuconolactone decarboxylase family protein [Candidatus Binataceae bacterium]|nr:carboxymuconolactone decarboxylase family protein [Candidatus Binataceae bacterium]
MSRIPLVEPENASPAVRALYESIESSGLELLNVIKLFGNSQHMLAGLYDFIQGIYLNAALSPRYRELAYLRASQVNSCHY